MTKPRIALFATDILGGGPSGKKIPVLIDLFGRLSEHFEIELYSFTSVNASKLPPYLKVYQAVSWWLPGRLKYLLVTIKFIVRQIFKPCKLIFAVSDYPAGRWAVISGMITNKQVIVQLIGFEAAALPDINFGNLTKPWLAKITRFVCDRTNKLVVVSDYQKKMAHECLPTSREIIVLPLRIDPEKFPFRKHVVTYPVEFIHIAYYSPLKGQDMMFEAFAKVSSSIECHLTVIGDYYDVPKVHTMMKDLGISTKVTFAGVVSQNDLPDYFQRAHILLHTARFETGCAVIQEAMASGVAVCGTDVGILSDIGEQYAVIVPVGDAAQLAEKILELVKDPITYQQMTERAYQWITSNGAVWSYENYLRFIRSALSE